MTEIKEILLRVAKEEPVRSISRTLNMHRDTIKKYISISLNLGVDPTKNAITDELVEKIKSVVATETKPLSVPRDDILLPHIERIEDYLEKGIKGSKILVLLKRDGIEVGDSSFYRFINTRCENYIRKNITVRLPETGPGEYSQADFGYMGLIWDEEAGRLRKTHALIGVNPCSWTHLKES